MTKPACSQATGGKSGATSRGKPPAYIVRPPTADLAVYSATKYLSGFSDMVAGVILGTDPENVQHRRGKRAVLGNILQPDEGWLLDRRLPTVNFRMNRQNKNAQHIVEALAGQCRTRRIYYPALFVEDWRDLLQDFREALE